MYYKNLSGCSTVHFGTPAVDLTDAHQDVIQSILLPAVFSKLAKKQSKNKFGCRLHKIITLMINYGVARY